MSILQRHEKIKKIGGFVIILLLVTSLAYAIKTITTAMGQKSPVTIDYPDKSEINGPELKAAAVTAPKPDESVVASKNGTKYYFSWCSGVKAISTKNKITFLSAKVAEKAGLSLAKNCKPTNPSNL